MWMERWKADAELMMMMIMMMMMMMMMMSMSLSVRLIEHVHLISLYQPMPSTAASNERQDKTRNPDRIKQSIWGWKRSVAHLNFSRYVWQAVRLQQGKGGTLPKRKKMF
jgi:hypothetical protein